LYTCEELGRILSARHKDATLLRAVMSGERPQAQDNLARLVLECGFREEWREKKETGALGRLRSSPLFSMEKLLSVARSMGERRSVGTEGGWGGSEGRSEGRSGSENVGATTLEALARTGLTPPEALRESLRLQPVSPPRYHRVNGGVGGTGGVGGLSGIGGGGGIAGGGPKRGGRIVAKRRRPSGGGGEGGPGGGGGGPSASSPGPPVAPCDILEEHLQKERVEFAGLVRRASGPSSAWGGGRGRGVGVGGGGGSNNDRGGGSGGDGDGDGPVVAIGRFSGYKGGKRVRDLQSEVAAVRIQRVVRDRTDRANLRRYVEEKRHIEPTPRYCVWLGAWYVVCGAWCVCVCGVLERRSNGVA
jgi:hypothetical protein